MAKAKAPGISALLPDLGDLIFLGVLYLLICLEPNFLFGDASIGWHIVAGDYTLEHRAVPSRDLFSYTFPNKAWLDYEWLFHVMMALLVKLGGINLLGVVIASAIAFLFLLLYEKCRHEGLHFLLAIPLLLLGEIASSFHWLARPHLVTFFGVYLFSTAAEDFYRSKISVRKLLILTVPYMLFWTNCHPGFLFGLGILAVYLVASFVTYLAIEDNRQLSFHRLNGFLLCSVLATAITLVNPYGFRLCLYIANYLQQGTVLAVTNEFQSPVFHGDVQTIALEMLYATLLIGLVVGQTMPSLPSLLLILAFGHLSLANLRGIPLFVLISLPATARLLADIKLPKTDAGLSTTPRLSKVPQRMLDWLQAMSARFDEIEVHSTAHLLPMATTFLLCVIALQGGNIFGTKVLDLGFNQNEVPTENLTLIKRLNLDRCKGFTFDNWGGYLAYKLGVPVFIDDRTDFYGARFYSEYGVVCETDPGYEKILDKYNIDWVLFPTKSELAFALKDNPDWQLRATDRASSLFLRAKPSKSEK